MVPQEEPQQEDVVVINDSIQRLRQQWNAEGLPDEEFLELYEEVADSENADPSRNAPSENTVSMKRWLYSAFVGLILFIFAVTLNYKLIKCIACSIQNYIYPGFRFMRKLLIPIICFYPSLTRLYYETCLVNNPFFSVKDLDCWPCRSVNNIIEVISPKPVIEKPNAPFIYKTEHEVVTLTKLKYFYTSNKHLFDDEAPLIVIDGKSYIIPTDMISQLDSGEEHNYVWEFNNSNVARLLRQIVSRPLIVPKFGQSIERYIIVDTSHEEFDLPDTECNFTYLLALSGSRTVELEPSKECRKQCKSLKIELEETYLLWYNWWYWRPFIQESTGNTTFIAHMGSYC